MNSEELNARIPYATPEELSIIREIAGTVPQDEEIVMIGAGPGVMLLALREGNPHSPITVIDNKTCHYAEAHLADSGEYPGYTHYIVADSATYGRSYWGDGEVAFLIVDGDHSYEGVLHDLLAWLPKIKVGGHIFMHDFDPRETQFAEQEQYPGVALAVVDSDLLNDNWKHLGKFGTAVVLRRDS